MDAVLVIQPLSIIKLEFLICWFLSKLILIKRIFRETLRSIEAGHPEAMEILIDSGVVDFDAVNENGDSPLHLAARFGNFELVVLLLGTGCDLKLKNKLGRTAKQVAKNECCERKDKAIINLIKEAEKQRKLSFNEEEVMGEKCKWMRDSPDTDNLSDMESDSDMQGLYEAGFFQVGIFLKLCKEKFTLANGREPNDEEIKELGVTVVETLDELGEREGEDLDLDGLIAQVCATWLEKKGLSEDFADRDGEIELDLTAFGGTDISLPTPPHAIAKKKPKFVKTENVVGVDLTATKKTDDVFDIEEFNQLNLSPPVATDGVEVKRRKKKEKERKKKEEEKISRASKKKAEAELKEKHSLEVDGFEFVE